jgi:hypothetical protein
MAEGTTMLKPAAKSAGKRLEDVMGTDPARPENLAELWLNLGAKL